MPDKAKRVVRNLEINTLGLVQEAILDQLFAKVEGSSRSTENPVVSVCFHTTIQEAQQYYLQILPAMIETSHQIQQRRLQKEIMS